MLTNTTARVLVDRGPRSWPAAALLLQARQRAAKKAAKLDKKKRKAEAKRKQPTAFN